MARRDDAAIAEVLARRTSVLFDSFEGLHSTQEIDRPSALAYQADVTSPYYRDNCSSSEGDAHRTMKMVPGVTYRIFNGWFDDAVCLQHLFPCVVSGGLVILDDCGWWDGCTRAVHDYLYRTKAMEPIRKTRSGVADLTTDNVQP
jgi:O-methyltransferase